MKTFTIGWLNKCRCGNKSHSVKTARGNESALWDDDAVKCNSCGRGGVIQVCEGQARVLWETDEEMAEGKPMSTITKERIANLLQFNSEGSNCQANAEQWEVHELARIALASLEAEAVGEVVLGEFDDCGCHPDARVACIAADGQADWENFKDGTRLYTAPPAPVSVPAAMEMDDDFDSAFEHGKAVGWNAYRAAMLQGADGNAPAHFRSRPAQSSLSPAQGGNSPVIPDGWVACSERMPDIGTEIFYFCQDDGLRDCGIVSSSNFSEKGDAQLYVHAEGYDLRFGVDISHWMPLPASPQQK